MLKRLVCVILICCTVFILFCACGEEDTVNVIYPISGDPECVDPQIAENDSARLVVHNCMEGLVRLDKNGVIKPGVAESWDISADGLTYTFKIREDACWQMLKSHEKVLGEDYKSTFSTKVTAADCAFGIERALRPETEAEEAYLLFPIKNAVKFNSGEVERKSLGINALDDSTLVITLERAYPDLLRVLTEPMCMPCDEEFFLATGAKYGLELKYTLCNGPYYVGRWVDGGSLTLYRNEKYKGYDSVNTNAVYLYVNKDEHQYISKFNQGDYNLMTVSDEGISSVKTGNDIVSFSTADRVYGFMFNCEDPVLSDINIRKALISATDFNTMLSKNLEFKRADGVVPDSCRWSDKSYRSVSGKVGIPVYAPDKAAELFKSGLEELETTNINISIICEEEFRTPVIRLIQKWEKAFGLALTVSVRTVDQESLASSVKKGEYQIAFTAVSAQDGNVLSFLDSFSSENKNNYVNYQDEHFDDVINKCKLIYSGTELIEKYHYLEQKLVNDGVFYPVYSENSYAFASDSLVGVFGLPGFRCFDFAGWGY